MTSFIISDHLTRKVPPSWAAHADPACPFCRIVAGAAPAFRVHEDERVVAFLDIMPLRPGHTLVVPKRHEKRVSELPAEDAAAVGAAVSRVAGALVRAMGNTALNVVCNQEYAQAVDHVHYHVIPAPTFESSSKVSPVMNEPDKGPRGRKVLTQKEMHRREFENREELDEEEGEELAKRIRAHL
ncbi:HIT-like protein [Gloeophyllum trabeum ATCC 11539]|uniref:HIT-like protein n=1 Tax=Gloeophyllum trabeum (strain ATCC 11539 / FP-39264 / Madison 617) TaxID=670483 RepID=S7Q3Z5_GLOTA|nr:HIT-like protein [Gloeophyllum trabeum ATCC 11539]EPQ54736.1 HIT-like protein [Gloeophyllum trabeum ATCC 11539]